MKKKREVRLCVATCLLITFAVWTVLVCFVDVQPIGPMKSKVGFATLNQLVHDFTGEHLTLYTVTDWLGLVPIGVAFGFAVFGFAQWIKRKSLLKVDRDILALGGFYIAVAAAFLLFEALVINYRPVLINGVLEASYPSSTTLLVLCIMPTAMMQAHARIKNKALRRCVAVLGIAFTAFMVMGRLIAGVHWATDIIGGALLSGGLVSAYAWLARERR